jgi:hypothetical protein
MHFTIYKHMMMVIKDKPCGKSNYILINLLILLTIYILVAYIAGCKTYE